MNVELRHLRYFLAVAEELHFTRAAERLHIAQPALSQQIRKLESETGVDLFRRTRRKVELTPAGRAMVGPARQALKDAAEALEVGRRAARGEVGHLRIGFIESAAMTVVPEAVRRFRVAHPAVGLSLSELAVDAQVEGLLADQLEVAILRLPSQTDGLQLAAIVEEGLVAAVPEAHPLAQRKRISAKRLAGEPLILLARKMVPGLYDQIISLQHDHGGAEIAQEATSIQAVLGLVAAGLGISLLPASVRHLTRSGIAFVPLSPSPRSEIQIAWRESDDSPVTAAFVEAVTGEPDAPG